MKRPANSAKTGEKFGGSVELPPATVSGSPLGALQLPRSKSDIPKKHGLPPAAYEDVRVEGNYALSPRSGSFHFDLPSDHDRSSTSHVRSTDAENSSPMSSISEISPRTKAPVRKPVSGASENIKSIRRKLTATEVIPDGYEGEVFNADAARDSDASDNQALHEKKSVLRLKQALDNFRFDSRPITKSKHEKRGDVMSSQPSPLQSSPPDHPTWTREATEGSRSDPQASASTGDAKLKRPFAQHQNRSYRKTRPHAIIVPAQKHSKQSTVERKSSMESEIVLRRVPMPVKTARQLPQGDSSVMDTHKAALPVDPQGKDRSHIHPALRSEPASWFTSTNQVDNPTVSIPTSMLVSQTLPSMNTSLHYVFEAGGEAQSQQDVHILSSRVSPNTATSVSPSNYSQSGPPSSSSLSTSVTGSSPGGRYSIGSPIYSASSVARLYKPLTPPVKINIPSPKKHSQSRSQTHLAMTETSPLASPSSKPSGRSQSSGDVSVPTTTRVKATSMTIGDIQDLVSETLVNERQRQLSRPAMSTINSSDSMGITPRAPCASSNADTLAGTFGSSHFSDTSGEEDNWI